MKNNHQAVNETIIDLLSKGKVFDDDEVKNLIRLSKIISIKNAINEKINELGELRGELRGLRGLK